jgi:exosortase/archaeosortase family protein
MQTRPILIPSALLILVLGVQSLFPQATARALCLPAARGAAAFLHLPLLQTAETPLALDHPLGQVVIAPGCSGAHFLALLLGLGAWTLLSRLPRRRALTRLAAFIPAALLITLTANIMRIVFAVFAQEFSVAFFPEGLHGAMHRVAGVTIFLPTLLVVCFLLERTLAHDRLQPA